MPTGLRMHSAWIGEHHSTRLGVLSCPDLVLAYIAAQTTHIRLAPAVNVLPLHNPIRVAETFATLDLLSGGRVDFAAGRGYDRREYLPFHVSFEDNQGFSKRAWRWCASCGARGPHLASRQALSVRRCEHHAEAAAAAAAGLYRLVLEALDRARGAARLRPDRGAVRRRHDVRRAAPGRRSLSRDLRQTRPETAAPDVQLLHPFRRYSRAGECGARAAGFLLQGMRHSGSPGDRANAPPSYRYFIDIVDRLQKMRPQDLTDNAVLLGSSAHITDVLKKVEAAGFDEVILYINVGLKPHAQVKDEMARFMTEVAPAFEGKHKQRAA